jgi:hypothetical protein
MNGGRTGVKQVLQSWTFVPILHLSQLIPDLRPMGATYVRTRHLIDWVDLKFEYRLNHSNKTVFSDAKQGVDILSAKKEMDIAQLSSIAKVSIRTPLLIQTSHTHLFGHTLIAGLLGLIFLFSSLGEWKKAAILALPFIGTIMDIGGMWLTRFVGLPFATLVQIGGSTFALSYVMIAVISYYELWLKREAHT